MNFHDLVRKEVEAAIRSHVHPNPAPSIEVTALQAADKISALTMDTITRILNKTTKQYDVSKESLSTTC
jgi:hypothetical protein